MLDDVCRVGDHAGHDRLALGQPDALPEVVLVLPGAARGDGRHEYVARPIAAQRIHGRSEIGNVSLERLKALVADRTGTHEPCRRRYGAAEHRHLEVLLVVLRELSYLRPE